jgi:hypothetical protein
MDGYEVARRYDTSEARSRSVAAGFDYRIGKPVDLSALQALSSHDLDELTTPTGLTRRCCQEDLRAEP